jgi:hypothetical protein
VFTTRLAEQSPTIAAGVDHHHAERLDHLETALKPIPPHLPGTDHENLTGQWLFPSHDPKSNSLADGGAVASRDGSTRRERKTG